MNDTLIEISDIDHLIKLLDDHAPLNNVVAHGLDLTCDELAPVAERLLATNLDALTLIGCEMTGPLLLHAVTTGAVVFPQIDGLPYRTTRRTLYRVDELYRGFDPAAPETYHDTVDAAVYRHWVNTGRAVEADIRESLARRLHDHSITDALDDVVKGQRVVAIMGGHGLARTAPGYAQVATMARQLTRSGHVLASGGGPGAMEATHLGAWLAHHPDAALAESLDLLSSAPLYHPPEPWLATAFAVRERFPANADTPVSLGVPTWLYGHEPPNAFATHIAKYFANSVREDGLLTVATNGIIFTPGSAGTVQEVFQDATQNHYETVGDPSPMVFFGTDFWTKQVPVIDVLRQVGAGRRWLDLITITDDETAAVRAIEDHVRS